MGQFIAITRWLLLYHYKTALAITIFYRTYRMYWTYRPYWTYTSDTPDGLHKRIRQTA
jgi:hypothetical protein